MRLVAPRPPVPSRTSITSGEAGQPGAHDEHPLSGPLETRRSRRCNGGTGCPQRERPGGEGYGGEEALLQDGSAAEIVTHEEILSRAGSVMRGCYHEQA